MYECRDCKYYKGGILEGKCMQDGSITPAESYACKYFKRGNYGRY